MLGISPESTSYEGQAACELEALAATHFLGDSSSYPTELAPGAPLTLQWGSLWKALLEDLANGVGRAIMAARFHRGVISGLTATARKLVESHGVSDGAFAPNLHRRCRARARMIQLVFNNIASAVGRPMLVELLP